MLNHVQTSFTYGGGGQIGDHSVVKVIKGAEVLSHSVSGDASEVSFCLW